MIIKHELLGEIGELIIIIDGQKTDKANCEGRFAPKKVKLEDNALISCLSHPQRKQITNDYVCSERDHYLRSVKG